MASNARRSQTQNQNPAREHRPPGSPDGLASRVTDPTQSKPLSGALRELLSDPLSGPAIVVYLAVLKLLLHFYYSAFSNYGLFFDELQIFDYVKHLDWCYVDDTPRTIWLAGLSRVLMGDSVFAVRFFPAIAGALTIVVVGLIARELGGGRFALGLAALAALIAPVYLGAQSLLSPPAWEPVWWGLCAYFLIRIIKTGNPRPWVGFGVILGLGFLNKVSMLFLGAALTAGLLLTPERKYLFDRCVFIGGLIALVIVSPCILWQIARGWPTVEFLAGRRSYAAATPAWGFLLGQVLCLHPLNLPIWLAGLGWFFFEQDARPFRFFGWTYLLLLGFVLLFKSQVYYFTPVYTFLLAGGAVAIERWVNQRGLRRLKLVLPATLVAGGLVVAPMVLPVLPIEKTDAYVTAATVGLLKNYTWVVTFAFHCASGWQNQAKVVAEVFHRLSPAEQADCIIFASNYREAAAIDFYGPALGLPAATASHQSYYFWGPPAKSGNLIIFVGVKRDISLSDLERNFEEVQHAATIESPEAGTAGEQNVPVYICRKPRFSLKKSWPQFRAKAFLND